MALTAAGPATRIVAVLGTGSIGTRHLGILRGLPQVQPLAVPVRANRRAELEQGEFATAATLEEAAREGASCCVIATDTGRHLADGLRALELGLHVLMEKPMAATAPEAEQLQRRAQQARRALMVGCVLRFSESLNTFREWLPAVGEVHTVRIECQSYLPEWCQERTYRDSYAARACEGGVLRDLIHEIDYAGWLFGYPARAQGLLRNLGRLGIASEEVAELWWQTPQAAAVSVSLDYLTRPARRALRACGAQGMLEWDGIAQTVTRTLVGAAVEVARANQPRDAMYAAEVKAFLQAVEGRWDPRAATAADGVRALAVCDAARRSSASRREELVVYP